MTDPILLDLEEIEAMAGDKVEVVAAGIDAFVFRTADGRLLMASMCLGCGMHIGFYEIEEGILRLDPDISTA